MFNLPQWCPITRHPGLQQYIEELINDLLTKLLNVYSFNILIQDKEYGLILEKYVIDLSELKQIQDNSNNHTVYNETEIFNDLRSSINDLVRHLERLNHIKDNTVSFDIVINTVKLSLGHSTHVGWVLNNEKDLTQFERDINWTKYTEDENLPTQQYPSVGDPYIKMFALVGCDAGPLVIHNYMEIIQDDHKGNKHIWLDKVYDFDKEEDSENDNDNEFEQSLLQ